MNESMRKIADFYDIKDQQELKKSNIHIPLIFRSAILYGLPYLGGWIYYTHMLTTPGESTGWFIWWCIGYVVFLGGSIILDRDYRFGVWNIAGKNVYNIIGQYLYITVTMISLKPIWEWSIRDMGNEYNRPLRQLLMSLCGLMVVLNIMLLIIGAINYAIWKVGVGYGLFVLSGLEKRNDELKKTNEKIKQENLENEKKVQKVQKLTAIQTIQPMQYMADAISLYNEANYEDAVANVRRALESYLYQRMEEDGVIFDEEKQINTFDMIKKLGKDKSLLHYLRQSCNACVHALENDVSIEKENSRDLINRMLDELVSYSEEHTENNNTMEVINSNVEKYFERAKLHEKRENEKDSLLNIRKSLESIVRGYIKYNHIICAYGHDKNLNGYIDMLFEQEIISAKSKNAMHKIRMASNKGAHVENNQTNQMEIQAIIDLLEKEIRTYLDSQKEEKPEEELLNRISEYEGSEELSNQDEDDYDDDYDYDDYEKDDYDEDDYYEENYNRRSYYDDEDDCMPSEYFNPGKYYDASREYDPSIQYDPYEYYNVFGINSDDDE